MVCPGCAQLHGAQNRAKVNRSNLSTAAGETVEAEPGSFWVMVRQQPDPGLHPVEAEGSPAP